METEMVPRVQTGSFVRERVVKSGILPEFAKGKIGLPLTGATFS